jgi:PAS domain S-box-containing protein
MSASPDATFVVDVRTDRVVEANDAAALLFERSRETLVGSRLAELPLEWPHPESHEQLIRTVLHQGSIRSLSQCFRTGAGECRIAELSAYRARLGHEVYVVLVGRDVTEARQMRACLAQSEERFRRLFTQMVSGYALFEYVPRRPLESPSLYCIEANPAFARLTGVPVREISNRAFVDILGTAERSWTEPLEEVVTTSRPAYFVKYSRRLRKWFEVSAYQPAPGQVACTFTDVTDRRRSERELARAKAALQQANDTKDRFIATLSHELRTPLMPILTAVSALEADPCLPLEVKEDLAIIRRNAEMEARLIEGLLDLTQFSGGSVMLRGEVVDVLEILQQAALASAVVLDSHGLLLEWEVETEMRQVEVDILRMRQVFSNLIKNAIEHTPPNGKITLRITSRPGGRVAIQVQDTGEGMAPDILPRVFDAFHQGAHRPGSRHGTLGLGLTLCRSIVELHRGRIEAASDGPGHGACFTIILPLA